MKIRYRILLTCVGTLLSLLSFSQLKINNNGLVGINQDNPLYTLDVNGSVRLNYNGSELLFQGYEFYPSYDGYISLGSYSSLFQNVYAYTGNFYEVITMSDKSLKTNIVDISNVEDKLFSLRPVKYNLKRDISNSPDSLAALNKTQDTVYHIGFIAQEVKEIFPEIVTENKDGVLGIRYSELIPVLVQAIKEQNEKIKKLEERIARLEKISK